MLLLRNIQSIDTLLNASFEKHMWSPYLIWPIQLPTRVTLPSSDCTPACANNGAIKITVLLMSIASGTIAKVQSRARIICKF